MFKKEQSQIIAPHSNTVISQDANLQKNSSNDSRKISKKESDGTRFTNLSRSHGPITMQTATNSIPTPANNNNINTNTNTQTNNSTPHTSNHVSRQNSNVNMDKALVQNFQSPNKAHYNLIMNNNNLTVQLHSNTSKIPNK